MAFPGEEFPSGERIADEVEVADIKPAQPDAPVGQAAVADAELAHEDGAVGQAGVAYAPPSAEPGSSANAPGGAVADSGAGADVAAAAGGTAVRSGTGAHNGSPVDAVADGRWSKIQATFVDDPRGSVAGAASLVDEAVQAFITLMREQQASLASSWQAEGAGTEQLRAAFREYRTFWNSLTGLSRPA